MKRRSIMSMVAVALFVLVAGCEADESKDDVIEYRAEGLAYDAGDDYIERYLLYVGDGTYERYIGGTYRGEHLTGLHWGTLFETGTYEEGSAKNGVIWLTSQKAYDFDVKGLRPLPIADIEKRKGTISDTTLTVEYRIWYSDGYFDYYDTRTREYKRK